MCEKCDQQKAIEETRDRLVELALQNPRPCVVCGEERVVGAGTWVPDEKHYLAAGGTNNRLPIFSFCLCEVHSEPSNKNETLVIQSVLRQLRTGRTRSS